MSFSRFSKSVLVIAAASTTNGATATGLIDTLGFDALSLSVHTTTADSTTNKLTTLKLSESDDTVVTNFVDITEFANGTNSGNITLPAPNTATTTPNLYKFNVDLRARKRYLKVTVTPPTTQTITSWGELTRAEKATNAAADAGAIGLFEG